MEWNPETISIYCQELINEYFDGDGFFNLKVSVSKRMRRMYGCVDFLGDKPIEMKISSYLLEHATDEEIEDVIKHEFAHWYAWYGTGKSHGHDELFKEICFQICCPNDGPFWKIPSLENEKTKWEVVCPDCGYVYKYHRANNFTKYPSYYSCRKCEGIKLYTVKNW